MMQYPRIVLSAVLAKLIFSVIIALEKAAGLLPEIKKFRLRGITMLTQRRQELILQYVREHGSITVTQLRDMLDTSESTIRRDITALDREGKLVKVFGGAVDIRKEVTTHEYTVAQKSDLNREEKQRIARYAACAASGCARRKGAAGRRRAESIDRGSHRRSGDAADRELSFYERIFREQRRDDKAGLHDSRCRRGACEADGDRTVQAVVRAVRQQ